MLYASIISYNVHILTDRLTSFKQTHGLNEVR